MKTDPASQPATAPGHPGPDAKKARILLPIVLAVAAVAVFLLVFWPSGHGKKGHVRSHNGTSGSAGFHEAMEGSGGADKGSGEGNTSATGKGSIPVGGGASQRPAAKGEAWWYKDKSAKSGGEAEGWWYQDKPPGVKTGRAQEPNGSHSPVGGSE